jgi:L-seryl-tRNA(Ser) seleniumtransferase
MTSLRDLPSVDQLLQIPQTQEWMATYGRPLTVEAIRCALDEVRQGYPTRAAIPKPGELLDRSCQILAEWTAPTLKPVVNASGVILHTNLGRAPLSKAAIQAALEVGMGYSNLEYDLDKGKRGSRLVHAEALL